MTFVFTSWYFVMLMLLAGIIACVVVCVMMDKKDRQIIKNFVKQNEKQPEEVKDQPVVEEKTELNTENVVE